MITDLPTEAEKVANTLVWLARGDMAEGTRAKLLRAADLLEAQQRALAEARKIMRAILGTDERGQGIGYADAMNAAAAFLARRETGV